MHAYGTRFLRDTRYRRLHLFARLHDEIAVLINDDDDIGQVLVVQAVTHEFIRVQTTFDELVVVVLQVTHTGIHEQLVAVLHLDDKRVERVNDAVTLGDDDLLRVGIRHGCQIMLKQRFVRRKLHHLRVHHH